MATTSRLLTLLSLLQARRDWSGVVLAERLGVTDRTVRRDVERLRDMGYRIDATLGPDGGYRLDAGSELPPLLFDDEQVVALAVGLQAAVGVGAGVEEAALRALTTVRQVMPARVRHRLDAVRFDTLPPPAAEPVDTDVLVGLSRAVRNSEVVRFDYAPRDSDASDPPRPARRVEPHHLLTTQGRWYLVAWDLERDGWRIFRADRIALRMPTGLRFTRRAVPGGDVGAFVSARFKGSDAGDRWPCIGTVVLHAPARDVVPFAGDGAVEDLGPDRCRLTSGSWSWVALAASLGRFDVDLDVEGPAELAQACAQLARRYRRAAP